MSNKRIIKNSAYLYIRLLVTMFVGMFTSRYVLSALGASDYGLYNVVGGVVSMMAYVNTMMVTTTYRFLAYEEGKPDGDVNKVFNLSFSLHIVAALIILILSSTIGLYYISNYLVVAEGKLADAYFVFLFSIINVVADVLGTPFRGLLVANEKFAVTVPIEIGTKFLVLGVAILLNYVPGNHLRYYASLITIVHCINPISYAIYSVKKHYDTIRWNFQRNISQYKAMFDFTGWNMLEVAAVMGEGQGSAIIINRFFGTILNASFGIARQLTSLVNMFAQGLGQSVAPQIVKSYSAGNHKRANELVIFASKSSFFLIAIPTFPLLYEASFILNLWLEEVPQFTSLFVKAMLIKAIIAASIYGIPQLIDASGNIKWFKIVNSSITLLMLPFSYILFSLGYPAYSISYIFVFISLLQYFATLVLLGKIMNYDVKGFLLNSSLGIFFVILMQIPVCMLRSVMNTGVLRFFTISVLSELVLFGSIYFVGLNRKQRELLLHFLREGLSK